jgi:hypothetical protein
MVHSDDSEIDSQKEGPIWIGVSLLGDGVLQREDNDVGEGTVLHEDKQRVECF